MHIIEKHSIHDFVSFSLNEQLPLSCSSGTLLYGVPPHGSPWIFNPTLLQDGIFKFILIAFTIIINVTVRGNHIV